MHHGNEYRSLTLEEIRKRPNHLQHSLHFQNKWTEFYFVGLLSYHPSDWISPSFSQVAEHFKVGDPDNKKKNAVWTFNGPLDITSLMEKYGEILEIYCGMYFTVLLIRKPWNKKLSKKISKDGQRTEYPTSTSSTSASWPSSVNDSRKASQKRKQRGTKEYEDQQSHKRPPINHTRGSSTHSLRNTQLPSKGSLLSQEVELQSCDTMKSIVILTNRIDLYGKDLEFDNVDSVSVGMFHIVVRRGKKLWSLGLNQFGQCSVEKKFNSGDSISKWEQIYVQFNEDFGVFQFLNPGSMRDYMRRSLSSSSIRSVHSLESGFLASPRTRNSPRSPRSPLVHFYQSKDGEITTSPLGSSPSNRIQQFIPTGKERNESEFEELSNNEDEIQTLTLENVKKRKSSIQLSFERLELLRSKVQPANICVDRNMSHMKQISELLPQFIQKLSSYSLEQKLEGAISIRKILARDENHLVAVNKFVECSGIEACIRFLGHPEEQLVSEIVWILIRVATTENQDYADYIFNENNVQYLITILEHSENDSLLELVVQLIGNLCAHEKSDMDRRVLLPHVMQVMAYSPPLELRRMCAWAISNIIRCMPYDDAKLALPTFSYIVEENEYEDIEILKEACRGMYYLSWNQISKEFQTKFNDDVEEYVIHCLISLALHSDSGIVQDTIKTIGNVISSPLNKHTRKCLNGNLLPILSEYLDKIISGDEEIYPGMMIDLCWIVSNICCSTTDIELVLEEGLLGKLKLLSFQIEDTIVQREIAYAFGNVITCGRVHQYKQIEEFEPIEHLTSFLKSTDAELVLLILDAIYDVMDSGIVLSDSLVTSIHEVSEKHSSQKIYKKGQAIITMHTTMKKHGQNAAVKRLAKLPPKPLAIDIPDIYCTFSATFFVFGRGQQVWGAGRAICLGINSHDVDLNIFKPVHIELGMLDSPIKSITGGLDHTFILTETGTLFVAGSNKYGCCASNRWSGIFSTFTKVSLPDPNMCIEQVACGAMHSVLLSGFNTVLTCGKGDHGRLGLGHFSDQRKITPLRGLNEIKRVYAGINFTGVVHVNEGIQSCGSNLWGMLGIKPILDSEITMCNSSTYTRMREMNSPPIIADRYLLDHKQSVGGYHLIIQREYEYTFEDRLLMSQAEDLFTDLVVCTKRIDSQTTTVKIGDDEFEVPNDEYTKLMSKDVSLHFRLKFLSDLIGIDFMTGCLPPETEAEEQYHLPIAGLSFWNKQAVRYVCQWILDHFPGMQFKYENIRKELGEAASSWRRKLSQK